MINTTDISTRDFKEIEPSLNSFVQEHKLSKREHDVLKLLVHQVVTAEDISTSLGISSNTVRIHLKNINNKVGTTSKSELLGRFIEYVIQGTKLETPDLKSEDLSILLVDDDESYVDLMKKAAESAAGENVSFHHLEDGQSMLDYLEKTKDKNSGVNTPSLILLDLNMPKLNGFQALERIKSDPSLNEIPVVIFSSSSTKSDISNIYALGGNSYVTKPGGFPELKKVMRGIISYWGGIGVLPSN